MSIKIKLLSNSSQTLKSNNDGSYDIFSSENKLIKLGETTTIHTGIIISLPIGHYGLIISSELVASKNIETSCFGSIHYHDRKLSMNTFKFTELILNLRNLGLTNHNIYIGDIIGKLVIVKTEILPIVSIESIEDIKNIDEYEEENISTDTFKKSKNSKIKVIPKSYVLWFKKMYRDGSETVKKYITPEIEQQLADYKNTDEWEEAHYKLNVESNFIWKNLSNTTKNTIFNDFIILKNEFLSNTKNEESDEPKKSKKSEESEESEESEGSDEFKELEDNHIENKKSKKAPTPKKLRTFRQAISIPDNLKDESSESE